MLGKRPVPSVLERRSTPLPRLQRSWTVAAFLLLLPGPARGEPYLAVRYGYKCSHCHFNPTGGGKRNRFGTVFSQTELPNKTVSARDLYNLLHWGQEESPAPADTGADDLLAFTEEGFDEEEELPASLADFPIASTFYSGYLTPFLSMGGDVRVMNRTIMRGATDSTTNTFDVTAANLYASVELLDGVLAFYLDETIAPGGASSREAFGIVRGPWDSYLKAGRILLPFGLRLQDDTAFIREITGFNFGVQDLGVELGLEPGPFSVSVALSNGSQGSTDDNRDKQITAMASFIQRHWRVGTQITYNNTSVAKRFAVGGFGGFHYGRFALLGEIDHIIDTLETVPGEPIQRQLLLYGAVNYQLAKGVNLKLTYDFADPDLSESDDSFIRVSTGVQYFITQFVELRAFYRFRDDTEDSVRDDESILEFELHLYF